MPWSLKFFKRVNLFCFLHVLHLVLLIFSITEYTSWYHSIFLATNIFSWLIQVSFVVLDILHLLVCDSSIGFVLKVSSYLEHRFFLLYIPLHYSPMLAHISYLILSILSLCYSFKFLPEIWFCLPASFL